MGTTTYRTCVLYPGVTDKEINILNMYTVQRWDYTLERPLTKVMGRTGLPSVGMMTIELRIGEGKSAKMFYEQMQNMDSYTYSILFDITRSGKQISSFSKGMQVIGCPVDIKETTTVSSKTLVTSITIQIQVFKICFLGSNGINKNLLLYNPNNAS